MTILGYGSVFSASLEIRVKTFITIGFILYSSILLALFKKKVVPPLQANNIKRFYIFGTTF